jgi:hypothetical protein
MSSQQWTPLTNQQQVRAYLDSCLDEAERFLGGAVRSVTVNGPEFGARTFWFARPKLGLGVQHLRKAQPDTSAMNKARHERKVRQRRIQTLRMLAKDPDPEAKLHYDRLLERWFGGVLPDD